MRRGSADSDGTSDIGNATAEELMSSPEHYSPSILRPISEERESKPTRSPVGSPSRRLSSPERREMHELRENLETARVEDVDRVLRHMEDVLAEREYKLRRIIQREKDDEAHQLLILARKEQLEHERARKLSEEREGRAVMDTIAIAEREQREAVKAAVTEATRNLQTHFAIEMDRLQKEHIRHLEAAKEESKRQIAIAVSKALAAEVARHDAQELERKKHAKDETKALRQALEEAQEEVQRALERRAEAEGRAKLQVTRATELIAVNEARAEATRVHSEYLEEVIARMDVERDIAMRRWKEMAEKESEVAKMQAAVEIAKEKAARSVLIEEMRSQIRDQALQIELCKAEVAEAHVVAAAAEAHTAEVIAANEASSNSTAMSAMRADFDVRITAAKDDGALLLADVHATLDAEKHIGAARVDELEARLSTALSAVDREKVGYDAALAAKDVLAQAVERATDAKVVVMQAEVDFLEKLAVAEEELTVAKLEAERRLTTSTKVLMETRLRSAAKRLEASRNEVASMHEARACQGKSSTQTMKAEASVIKFKQEADEAMTRLDAEDAAALKQHQEDQHAIAIFLEEAQAKCRAARTEARVARAAADSTLVEATKALQVAHIDCEASVRAAREQVAASHKKAYASDQAAAAKLREAEKAAESIRLAEHGNNEVQRHRVKDSLAKAGLVVSNARIHAIGRAAEEARLAAIAKVDKVKLSAKAARAMATEAEVRAQAAKVQASAASAAAKEQTQAAVLVAEEGVSKAREATKLALEAEAAAAAIAEAKREADVKRSAAEAERRKAEAKRMANLEQAIIRRPGGRNFFSSLRAASGEIPDWSPTARARTQWRDSTM